MAVLLSVLCAVSAGYCLVRCLDSYWRYGHGVGLDAWHVAMGVAMALMLLGSGQSGVYAVVFGAGAAWCAWVLWVRDGGAEHLRLGVALAAMALMLAPTAASAAPAGHEQHHDHDHGAAALGSIMGSALLVAAVAVGIAALLALRSPGGTTRARLGLAGEVVMAGALGYMAALAL
jgi:hypothetical protein